ncbi:MAG: hypothetical protein ACXAC5_02085 [Promethearchaeota archaeon]
MVALISGCETKKSSDPASLPTDAIKVVDKGNGWITFELDGTKYLYHRSDIGGSTHQAITVIPKLLPSERDRNVWD